MPDRDRAKTKMVQGFEIPKKLARELTDATVLVLAHLSRRGAVYLNTDDSPEDRLLIEQLTEIVAKEGYFHICYDRHECLVYIPERFALDMPHRI